MPGEVLSPQTMMVHKQDLERQELEYTGGGLSAEQSLQLLALYLYFDELVAARHFWQRIPQAQKESCPELTSLWGVGKSMLARDFADIHKKILAAPWAEAVKQIITHLQEKVREQTITLVSNAYTSINKKDLADMLMLSAEDVDRLVTVLTWKTNDSGQILPVPRQLDVTVGDARTKSAVNLESLTRLVSYLEN